MKYKNFKIYSNDKINHDIKNVLTDAMALVQQSELFDSSYQYNIILCHNSFFNKLDDRVIGAGPAARQRLNNVLVKVQIDPTHNLAFAVFPRECEVNLTYLLAHEMIHCLQANKYGIRKFNPIRHPEFWKLEGYPEYISRKLRLSDKSYSLTIEIERYINLDKINSTWITPDDGECETYHYYYKGRLMIEYLLDVKHMSYDQVLKDTVSESAIFNEMINWKDRIKVNTK